LQIVRLLVADFAIQALFSALYFVNGWHDALSGQTKSASVAPFTPVVVVLLQSQRAVQDFMNNARQELFAAVFDRATLGGRGAAARAIDAAIAEQGDVETPLHRALAAIGRGAHDINAGHYEEALNAIIPALEELECSAFSKRLGWVHTMVGFAVGMMGNPERGLEWTARAVAAVDVAPASVDSFTAYCNHGCLLGMVGEHDGSKEVLERAWRIALAAEDAGGQYIALSNIAYGLLMKLQESETLSPAQKKALAGEALMYAEQARKLCSGEDIGLDPGGMDSLVGQAMLHAGDVPGAMAMFKRALEAGLVHPSASAEAHLGLAIAHRLSGQHDDARTHLQIACEMATAEQLGLVLDRVMAEGVLLESAAGNMAATLDWTTRRCHFLQKHYRQRLRLLARSTELAAQADSVSRRASQYQEEAESLSLKTRDWDNERLRDALTHAFNRRGLARVAGHIFAPFRQLATVVVDIDNFTSINEEYGRSAGDLLLKHVAATIASHMRHADQFARAEGAEFQLLLLDSSADAALGTCEQIRIAIERERWIPSHPEARITVSVGICNRTSESSFEATLAAAERALEQAKKSGRNRTCVA
jgi:diguanylate cyclase (GGDEF)-like protein